MTISAIDNLPPYKIRISKRAKYIRLYIHPQTGLELVLPEGVSEKKGLQFMQARREWIARHKDLIHAAHQQKEQLALPTHIDLPAVGRQWEVVYQNLPTRKVITLKAFPERLLLMGPTNSMKPCLSKLHQWLRDVAEQLITPLLQQLSEQTQLTYNGVTYRKQKTLWGSCSRNHHLNVNYKLLFLNPDQLRYVLIHELAHTKHFNHSKSFWRLVEQFEPNFSAIDAQLNQAGRDIPAWVQ